MPAIDVPGNVSVSRQHHVAVNQTRPRNRWPPSVNRALNSILARPSHHLPRRLSILHAAEPHFAKQRDSGFGQRFEILLHHPMLNHRRPSQNFHPARPQRSKRSLRANRHSLQSDHILRPPRRMHLASRNHGRHAAMKTLPAAESLRILYVCSQPMIHRIATAKGHNSVRCAQRRLAMRGVP